MRNIKLEDYEIEFLTGLLESQIYEISGMEMNNDNPYSALLTKPIKKLMTDVVDKLNDKECEDDNQI